MTNLNIIVTKPATGTFLNNEILVQPITISRFDNVKLNIALEGFDSPSAVEMSFEFPNGTILEHKFLYSTADAPNLFTLDLTEDFNENMAVGNATTVTVTDIRIVTETLEYTKASNKVVQFNLYKTNTTTTYTPNDIEKLFICVNKLQKEIDELKNK